ncbi:hypothetical protein MJO29_000027 [Puccinia striiformis f. sp. tritici]|uniref:Uncharacterized protein n=1 Tax=Puccinia striiformis f. sp. tritici PST-78 TaxID=1165861 RepID=A0A0L0UPL4_9BASI|nr:hypothetical protein MJO29_012664 [Puccinia striiformis f. sp. tritici]KAI7966750.1 hypothetical protein MJO29_000027 [Puccinia striiformis f. sp. tritici]KNE88744.1 hypothetical protein PSTG_17839 [Puccinia striiformis f. sp. tritici PST-78]
MAIGSKKKANAARHHVARDGKQPTTSQTVDDRAHIHDQVPGADHHGAPASPPLTQAATICQLDIGEDADESSDSVDSRIIDPRIATIPEKLMFFLDPNLNLDKVRPVTKETLLKIIKHFFPTYKVPKGVSRGTLVQHFTSLVHPFITEYLEIIQSQQIPDDTEMEEAASAKPDFSGINPHSNGFSVDTILSMIDKYIRPKIKLPPSMSKASAIAFYHKYIAPQPKGGYPSPFTTKPKAIPKPYHKHLTRDEIRFALQVHCPHIYIPIAATKVICLALYEQFILDDISDQDIFEGVDYYVLLDV